MQKLLELEEAGATFVVGVVTTPEELEACERLRFRVYALELHQVPVEEFPNGRERDVFDERSQHFFVLLRRPGKEDEIVGTVRAIDAQGGCLVEGADFSGTTFVWPKELDRATTIEASRLIGPLKSIASERAVSLWLLLIHGLFRWCRENGITHWVFAIQAAVGKRMMQRGWPIHVLVPGDHAYHGSLVMLGSLAVPPTEEEMYPMDYFVRVPK